MKGKNHKAQDSLNTRELNTAQVQTQVVAQPDMEELTHEELEQVSGAGSRNILWRNT